MSHLENHNPALMFARKTPTAPARPRTTTSAGIRDRWCRWATMYLSRPATIRVLDESSASKASVPIVTAPRIKLDLAWVPSVLVALSVPLALAIPFEILRQIG